MAGDGSGKLRFKLTLSGDAASNYNDMLLTAEIAKGLRAEGQEVAADKVHPESEDDQGDTIALMLSIDISGASGGGAALAEKLVGASFYDSAGRVSGVTVEGVPFAGAAPTAAADDDDDDGYDDDEFEEDRAWDAAQKKLQLARDLHALRLSLSTDASDDGRVAHPTLAKRVEAAADGLAAQPIVADAVERAVNAPEGGVEAGWLRQSLHGAECDALADGLFEYADRDRDAGLTQLELVQAFNDHPELADVLRTTSGDKKAGSPRIGKRGVTKEAFERIFAGLDANNDNEISRAELRAWLRENKAADDTAADGGDDDDEYGDDDFDADDGDAAGGNIQSFASLASLIGEAGGGGGGGAGGGGGGDGAASDLTVTLSGQAADNYQNFGLVAAKLAEAMRAEGAKSSLTSASFTMNNEIDGPDGSLIIRASLEPPTGGPDDDDAASLRAWLGSLPSLYDGDGRVEVAGGGGGGGGARAAGGAGASPPPPATSTRPSPS